MLHSIKFLLPHQVMKYHRATSILSQLLLTWPCCMAQRRHLLYQLCRHSTISHARVRIPRPHACRLDRFEAFEELLRQV